MLAKTAIKQAFAGAANHYDSVADLQRRAGIALLKQLPDNSLGGNLLDLGCGTGFLTGELFAKAPRSPIIAVDIALPMLQTARQKLLAANNIRYVCADAEQLPLASHSIDTICSNLALQWCYPLDKVLQELRRVLKPGGWLLFSTFGNQSLQELAAAWREVDHYRHVNDFYDLPSLQQQLQQAGFVDSQFQQTLQQSYYLQVLDLLRELKQLGAGHVIQGRNPQLTSKARLQAMQAAYENHRTAQGIPATFDIINILTRT